jgi:cytochrome c peroxidase
MRHRWNGGKMRYILLSIPTIPRRSLHLFEKLAKKRRDKMAKQQFQMTMGLLIVAVILLPSGAEAESRLSPIERLGKSLFNDRDLSSPTGQSCNSCHGRQVGFSGPKSRINRETAVYPGAVSDRYGNRKPPAAAYSGDVPPLVFDEETASWFGGLFWDGRATGWRLGDPLAEQALGPFLNPLEQNNADAASVCTAVAQSTYSALFESVWGAGSLDCTAGVDETYDRIGISIAAYERSTEVSPYTSKYDYYLMKKTSLTGEESMGLALFDGIAGCADCHSAAVDSEIGHPTFTRFGYANLGVPRNEENPFYKMPEEWNPDGAEWIDPGLGRALLNMGYGPEIYEPQWGKHRVPTLRNVDRRPGPGFSKAFGHNGSFKSIDEFIHYLNTRDVPGAGWMGLPWPAAEVTENMTDQVGDLGLTPSEEASLVAFLGTLSDGFTL